jgi:hypothetical protein
MRWSEGSWPIGLWIMGVLAVMEARLSIEQVIARGIPMLFGGEHPLEQRLLLVFRAEPSALAQWLPVDMRLRLFRGLGIAGIWIDRQERVSRILPARLAATQNVVHHIYVTKEKAPHRDQAGILTVRRDTSSRWQSWSASGPELIRRHHARFRIRRRRESIDLVADSDDRVMHVALAAQLCEHLPNDSVFRSVADATAFLRPSNAFLQSVKQLPESPSQPPAKWRLQPLAVQHVESSLFGCPATSESLQFDSAFTLRSIEFSWQQQPAFCGDAVTA